MIYTDVLYANAAISHDPNILRDVHLKNKNIVIYQRNIESLQQELKTLTNQSLECRASGTVDEITIALQAFFNDNLPNTSLLLADVTELLNQFQQVTEANSFRVLLATVSTNMCRKFHTDINTLRMLCTYVGSGTLWAPDEIINQKALRSKDDSEKLILDESLVQQVNKGDVVILKGALYPESSPILHRSPTIEEKGEKRLLLRIDTNENLWT